MLKAKASRVVTPGQGPTLAMESVISCIPVDKGIDFGYVCVGKTMNKTLLLTNSGNSAVRFNFETAAIEDKHYFVFSPAQGKFTLN
jgi:hypothetical protein